MSARRPFIRDVAIAPLLGTFLATGVTTVLVVRAYLAATGFPQVGNARDSIHIAHALWGGLLLAAALVIALALVPRRWRWVVAVAGGIGFGLFIDELGKFITEDVDYFFRPTPAIIYATFVVMYLTFRELSTHRPLSPVEALANAGTLVREATFRPLTASERDRAGAMLDRADQDHPLVTPLRAALGAAAPAAEEASGRIERIARAGVDRYRRLVHHRWFPGAVTSVALIATLISSVQVVGFTTGAWIFPEPSGDWLIRGIPLAAAALSAGLVCFGVGVIWHDRLMAYRAFDRALLINLLITQIFLFAHEEFWAAFGFVGTLALLVTVRLGIGAEKRRLATIG